MAALNVEINLAISAEIWEALERAAEHSGLRVSQYARLALCEKLDRENWLQRRKLRSTADNKSEIPAVVA